MSNGPLLVRGTCVAVAGQGVLLRGPSGAGKSDVALRLIDGGALLVSDDYALAMPQAGGLWLSAPAPIAGRLEVRGVGILAVPAVAGARLALVVDLVAPQAVPRLPEAWRADLCGVSLPRLALDGAAPSTPAKIRLALAALGAAGPDFPGLSD